LKWGVSGVCRVNVWDSVCHFFAIKGHGGSRRLKASLV
jgi:hypothetical protein